MECREVRVLAEAFVSEQLLVKTTQAVVAHLQRCRACGDEVEGLRRVRAATRSAFESAPDLGPRPEFTAALTARLHVQAVRRSDSPTAWRSRFAIAASLLLILGGGWGWREWSASSLSELLHAAVGDHRYCALTFRLAERPIGLEEAARRFGGVYGPLNSVELAATNLTGGPLRILERHSCVFEGRRFAHIVLRYKDESVSLLIADGQRLQRSPGRTGVVPSELPVTDGFHVASFGSAQGAVLVVSSLNDDDLQEVARALTGPVSRALAGA
jgi:hypothetical protein